MSVKLMALVWELDLPPGSKLVLLALADQANDAGVQCWPSLTTIAKKSGQNERTVRRAIRSLEEQGHLTCHFRTGESTQYHVHPGHHAPPVKMPPRTNATKTPDTTPPKPSGTIRQKKGKPSSGARAKQAPHPLPTDWEPVDFGEGTECAQIIALWQPGRKERELSKFRANHEMRGSRWRSWQAAWKTWVLNSVDFERAGNGRSGTFGMAGPRPDPTLAFVRAAVAAQREDSGDHWQAGAALPAGQRGGP